MSNSGDDVQHCCQQYADLAGLSVEEVQRLGSCGCVQAKKDLAALRAELERVRLMYEEMAEAILNYDEQCCEFRCYCSISAIADKLRAIDKEQA